MSLSTAHNETPQSYFTQKAAIHLSQQDDGATDDDLESETAAFFGGVNLGIGGSFGTRFFDEWTIQEEQAANSIL